MRLPYKVQKDEDDAQLALQFIQADQSVAFDIASTVDAFQINMKTYWVNH